MSDDVLRIAVLGAAGRVGRRVVAAVLEATDLGLVAAVTRPGSDLVYQDAGRVAGVAFSGIPLGTPEKDCFFDADVVIDFSLPGGLREALPFLGDCALVTGTTGLDADTEALVAAHAAKAPVIQAANFSTGVNVLLGLAAIAARALPDHDVEIVEAHHRHKKDAPSGTALALAAAIGEGRGEAPILDHGRHGLAPRVAGHVGLHALRMGDVVGEHQVWLAGEGDRVLLGHVATSRDTFAHGALRAARFTRGRAPGRYTMRDVLGLT